MAKVGKNGWYDVLVPESWIGIRTAKAVLVTAKAGKYKGWSTFVSEKCVKEPRDIPEVYSIGFKPDFNFTIRRRERSKDTGRYETLEERAITGDEFAEILDAARPEVSKKIAAARANESDDSEDEVTSDDDFTLGDSDLFSNDDE